MKTLHFETIKPVCPRCRQDLRKESPLTISTVFRTESDTIIEAILLCTNPDCRHEYPVIDGIPIVVHNLREYISNNIYQIMARSDLHGSLESLLGDCCGPGSALDVTRQHISSYAYDHYGDIDPQAHKTSAPPGAVARLLARGLQHSSVNIDGPAVDLGCSVGRTTFELAKTTGRLTLGVDLNFSMLRVATDILNHGRIRFPHRRVGMVYDQRNFEVSFPNAEKVDFWLCDAMALPFAQETFAFVSSLNVLDCVTSPFNHLASLDTILQPGGKALLATPYDWSPAATPVESWLGGHSQRSPKAGSSENMLRSLLCGGDHPHAIHSLKLVHEEENIAWTVRLHDRCDMHYKVHMFAVEKQNPQRRI